jgi:uncharacterized membrane protein YhiD involved in acid resistance
METASDYMMQFLGGAHQALTPGLVLASLGLSFLLASLIAVVYQMTFRGFTYSRTYVQALILGSIVTCMLIMAIGSNFARGLGILGTLAIIRFRVPVHDPRDGMFIFASLGAGIACGAGGYLVAVAGTAFFAGAALLLHVLPFASRREYEGLLRFQTGTGDGEAEAALRRILETYCTSYGVLGVCDAVQGERAEFSYQVRLKDPSYQQDLVAALKKDGRFESPTLMLQRNTVEL